MTGVIYLETIRRHWRQALYWSLAVAFFAAYAAILTPDMQTAQAYVQLLESMPVSLMQIFGVDDISSLVSPEGFIGFAYYLYVLILIAVYAVVIGQDVTAADEDRGVMDIVLSLPVSRRQVVIEKILAYSTMMALVVGLGHLALVVGKNSNQFANQVSDTVLISGSISLLINGIFIMTVTAFLGALLRRKSTAVAMAGAFVGFSYLIDAVARMANSDTADMIANISLFRLYDGANMLFNGINWVNVFAVFAAAIILSIGTILLYQKRDIAV